MNTQIWRKIYFYLDFIIVLQNFLIFNKNISFISKNKCSFSHNTKSKIKIEAHILLKIFHCTDDGL